MMFTTPMEYLSAAILSKDKAAVSDALLRIGSLDAVRVQRGQDSRVASSGDFVAPDSGAERFRDIRVRIEGLFALAGLPVARVDPSPYIGQAFPDPAALSKDLDSLVESMQGIRERQKELQTSILRLEELGRQAELSAPRAGPKSAPPGFSSFLSLRFGSLPEGRAESLDAALAPLAAITMPAGSASGSASGSAVEGRIPLAVLGLKSDDARIKVILASYDWKEADAGSDSSRLGEAARAEMEAKHTRLVSELEACSREYAEFFKSRSADLSEDWARLRAAELSLRLRSVFSTTDSVAVLSGWIPAADRDKVEKAIRAAAEERCYIEWLDVGAPAPDGTEPPVAMEHRGFLAPFQTLVTNFGVPGYGTVDPTPFVAAAYLSMFGLMFGDAGHGLVLVLVGLFSLLRARKNGKPETLPRLILYCGGAAILAGLLFGSIFGLPILPPLWFNYHGVVNGEAYGSGGVRSIYGILGITVKFGMAILGMGLAINWVNLFRKREWLKLFLDKSGLAGGWIYGAGAWMAFYFVAHDYRQLPPAGVLLPLLGIPTVLLGLKAPLEDASRRRKGGGHAGHGSGGFAGYLMEWVVEILEVYSGYLANTLSFMRVAGLGIAHVSLMTAFFQIASMTSRNGKLGFSGILILVVGNALVIVLEGISAGIQSLRLNYYEFFSKYFNGTGRAYRPISFKSGD